MRFRHFNPHGDLVGTSDAAGVWAEIVPGDEYGLEATSQPDRQTWLAAHQRSQVGVANLTRMGVRLYDPTTGRFHSVDPIDGGSANAYDYVAGDPINYEDLDGLEQEKRLSDAEKEILRKSKNGRDLRDGSGKLTDAERKLWKSARQKQIHNEKVVTRTRNERKRQSNFAKLKNLFGQVVKGIRAGTPMPSPRFPEVPYYEGSHSCNGNGLACTP